MSRHTSKGYTFNIVDGQVQSVYELKHNRLKLEKMDADEIWSVVGSTVVKTEYEHGVQEITTYADADLDGIYTKVSKAWFSTPLTPSDDTQHAHETEHSPLEPLHAEYKVELSGVPHLEWSW